MKYLSKILMLSLFAVASLSSCKKDENKINYTSGTNPVLKSSVASSSTIPFNPAQKDFTALSLSWTNPNYQLTTGVSSQDVVYTIEIDTVGANFTNPFKKQISVTADLMKDITVGDLNKALVIDMKLEPDMAHNIEVRVVSSLGTNNAAALYSNVFKYTVTPYAIVKVALPPGGNLYLVGDATPGSWSNPVPVPSQQFTKTGSATYEITIALTGGKEYLLLPENGSWSNKYAVKDKSVAGLWQGGDYLAYSSGGDNFPGPPVTGNYKITVDFKEGKFKVVKL